MLWLLAIFLPPVAILLCGKPFQALINIPLCLLMWLPGVIHAMLVVSEYKSDERSKRQAQMIAEATKKAGK